MSTWAAVPSDYKITISPVGLRLLDELTNESPLGSVTAALDIQVGASWVNTGIQGVITPSGILTYPGLQREVIILTGQPPRNYRVRLSTDLYIPYYSINSDGITFPAVPYNDGNLPAVIPRTAIDTLLIPAPNYPFPSHIPVLRGVVKDAAGNPVQNAYVTQGATERSLTDSRGTYALPLRWVQPNTQVAIDAVDQRTNRTGSINIQIPAAIGSSQEITIN